MMELADTKSLKFKTTALITRDLETAREVLSRRYCQHRVVQKYKRETPDVRYMYSSFSKTSLNSLQYGTAVCVEPKEFETFYMLHMPLCGQASIKIGYRDVITRPELAVVVSPMTKVSTCWSSDCRQLMLQLDRQSLERALSAMILQPIDRPLEFEPEFDTTSAHGQAFLGLICYLATELMRSDALAGSRIVSSQFEQTLLTLLLNSQRHSYSNAIEALRQPACPRHVAKAYDYMIAMANEPITIEDLARVSGVGSRTLYEGFRRFKGRSPMACLRSIRMDRVRHELLAMPDRADVTQVAYKWGFFHLGRFARRYRQIFGEYPSQTLDRNRPRQT
jgi:AraC-like DNA-binding protein